MDGEPVSRRRHSAALKARVLEACAQPGASIARIALEHGLNANLVHKWRHRARGGPRAKAVVPVSEFVALPVLPAAGAGLGSDIRISIRRGDMTLDIRWPVADAAACAQWLVESLR